MANAPAKSHFRAFSRWLIVFIFCCCSHTASSQEATQRVEAEPSIRSQSVPATERQPEKRRILAAAEFQVDFAQKSATLKPLTKVSVMSGEKLAQPGVLAEETAVTDLIRLRTGNVQFDLPNKIFSFDATLANISSTLIFTPIRAIIQNLRHGSASVLRPDGGGNRNGAFFQYTDFVGLDKLLRPNETSATRNWQFFAPQLQQFSFTVLVEGELQRTTEPPAPIMTPPTSPTKQLSVQVSGNADPNAQIEIVGGAATATATANASGAFSANVTLSPNRNNRLFATAINNIGRSAAPPVSVIHDALPPAVFIDVPADSADLTNAAITVTGRVSDALSGFMGLKVTVNGQSANVVVGSGTNGMFERPNVPLTLNAFNPITVVATDVLGNTITKQIVVRRTDPTGKPLMVIVSGNGQSARVNTELAQPMIVRVTQANGSAFVNKVVTFDVTRSNGRLAVATPVGDGALMVQARTNEAGLATVYWKLGSDAGCGNNRVSVTSTSIAGTILFCASATPNPAAQINIGTGNNQRAETGGPAPEPLRVWVNDGVNGVGNVPVIFTVTQGGGKVNAANTITANTDVTGHAG